MRMHGSWNYRRYGSARDPIHKSHLNAIAGDYGCPRQFRYQRDAEAADGDKEERDTVSGKAAAGTAAHETIARALNHRELRVHILTGKAINRARVDDVFCEEYAREIGGRQVSWRDEDAAGYLHDIVTMITGLLNDMHNHVAEVVLVEPGFIAPLGKHWISGHIDLVYRPRKAPQRLALADWKTGASKPALIELDHGWESGVYAAALQHGVFVPREALDCAQLDGGEWRVTAGQHTAQHRSRYIAERQAMEAALIELALATTEPDNARLIELQVALAARSYLEFPAEAYRVHLRDYIPYAKSGKKAISRPEDIAFHGYEGPQRAHVYQAGDRRGPAWLPIGLTEHDVPRLAARLRNITGMIRMGCFIDQVGERCNRCSFAKDCLTSGYAPVDDERDEVERMLKRAGVRGEVEV